MSRAKFYFACLHEYISRVGFGGPIMNVNLIYHVQCSYLINILSIMLEVYSLIQGKIMY